VQTLRFVLSAFLQQIRVEPKAKKQEEGEKEKKRVKAREGQIEIRRQIKKNTKRAKETNAITRTDGN